MWVNVKESMAFEDRVAVATIDRRDMINIGVSNDSTYKCLEGLMNSEHFSEAFLRDLLKSIGYNGVDEWVLLRCYLNFAFGRIEVLACHHSFAPNPAGSLPPYIEKQPKA